MTKNPSPRTFDHTVIYAWNAKQALYVECGGERYMITLDPTTISVVSEGDRPDQSELVFLNGTLPYVTLPDGYDCWVVPLPNEIVIYLSMTNEKELAIGFSTHQALLDLDDLTFPELLDIVTDDERSY